MEYSIGEFSKLTGLGIHTLRYYEKEGLIVPERNSGGRRCYSDKDFTWIEFIKRLKDTGMPIKEIRHYAKLRAAGESTLSDRMEMLVQHRQALDEQIARLQEHKIKLEEKIMLSPSIQHHFFIQLYVFLDEYSICWTKKLVKFIYRHTKLQIIAETASFCLIVYFCPNRHPISGLKNTKKRGSPPTPVNPSTLNNPNRKLRFLFILSHSSILSPTSNQIPMVSTENSRLYLCYTFMTSTPFTLSNFQFDNSILYRHPLLFGVAQLH